MTDNEESLESLSNDALREKLRSAQLWADHVESLLAQRTEKADIWRRRAEERNERITRLEQRAEEGVLRRLRRRLRARPEKGERSQLAPTNVEVWVEPPRDGPQPSMPIVHPTVVAAIIAEDAAKIPPLLERLNSVVIRREEDVGAIKSADLLVVVGDEGVTKAERIPQLQDWIRDGHPVVSIATTTHKSLTASDLEYFDEGEDVFRRRPAEDFPFDRELHPTLARLGAKTLELIGLSRENRDPASRERLAAARLRSLRSTASPHAVAEALLATGGVEVPTWRPEALAVLLSRRPDFAVSAVEQLAGQTYRPLRLAVGLHGEAAAAREQVRQILAMSGVAHAIETLDETISQGQCLNLLTAASPGDVVLKIDDDDLYAPCYIDDMVNSLVYSGADILGKASAFVRLRGGDHVLLRDACYEPVSHVVGPTITVRRQVWDGVRFPNRADRVDSKFLQAALSAGFTIMGHHPWDFCVIRHDRGHSWTASDDFFLATGRPVETTWERIQTQ